MGMSNRSDAKLLEAKDKTASRTGKRQVEPSESVQGILALNQRGMMERMGREAELAGRVRGERLVRVDSRPLRRRGKRGDQRVETSDSANGNEWERGGQMGGKKSRPGIVRQRYRVQPGDSLGARVVRRGKRGGGECDDVNGILDNCYHWV